MPLSYHLPSENQEQDQNTVAAKAVLSCRQSERGSKAFCDAEQLDRDLASPWHTHMASEPLSAHGRRECAKLARAYGSQAKARGGCGQAAPLQASPRWVDHAPLAYRHVDALSGSRHARGEERRQ